MNILFIIPRASSPEHVIPEDINVYSGEHIGTGYLKAALYESGHHSEVIDLNYTGISLIDVVKEILDDEYEFVGITCNQYCISQVKKLVLLLRQEGFAGFICVGGQFPTLAPNLITTICPGTDFILTGEADLTLLLLLERLARNDMSRNVPGLWYQDNNKGWVLAMHPQAVENLDTLPYPEHYQLKREKSQGIPLGNPGISGSRGCPHNKCTFCSTAAYYKSIIGGNCWRARSAENVVEEMLSIYESFGSKYFVFIDETVFDGTSLGRLRMEVFADRLLAIGSPFTFFFDCRANDVEPLLFERLRNAGLVRVYIGFESMQTSYLSKINKGTTNAENLEAIKILRMLDIDIIPGFIPFHPLSTIVEVVNDFRFLVEVLEYNAIHKYVKRMLPEVGTPFYNELLRKNMIPNNLINYDFENNVDYYFADREVQDLFVRLKSLVLEDKCYNVNVLYEEVMKKHK
ncbi:MAG: B12-binding domain-containing radical SAM protein [Syntrophales bacterium]